MKTLPKKFKCLFCEDTYTKENLEEFREMGESFWHTKKEFVCPDCYADLKRLPLEEQLKALLEGSAYNWEGAE